MSDERTILTTVLERAGVTTLLDNYGVEPITAPPEGACDAPLP